MRREVSAYVDGELDPAASAAVENHLGRCWGCNSAMEQMRLIKASLRRSNPRRFDALSAVRLRRWAGDLSTKRS